MKDRDDQYNEDYFLRGQELGISGYTNYRWLPELTIPMVSAMIRHLGIKHTDTILDFGCARGYVVRAFRELRYNAWGYDISRWALENADEMVKQHLILADDNLHTRLFSNKFDWVIAKDVLEHIANLGHVVDTIMAVARRGVFVVVPLAHYGPKYDVPEYDKDVTHIWRRDLGQWVARFHRPGWSVEARYRINGIKDNYAQYPTGNGFITARRIAD